MRRFSVFGAEKARVAAAVFLFVLGMSVLPAGAQDSTLQFYPVQILNTFENRVCQHVWIDSNSDGAIDEGEFQLAWQSAPLDFYRSPSVRMGDVDNDGDMEIVACGYYVRVEGTKKNRVTYYYSYEIQVFEEGEVYGGQASWSVELPEELEHNLVRDSWIGDVDPQFPGNELVLMRTYILSVYHFSAEETYPDTYLWKPFSASLDSIDVGDADNDGQNEIVVDSGQIPWILDGTLSGWTFFTAEAVPLDEYGDADVVNLTHVRVRDVDGDGLNEIISAGTNERLMVWECQLDGSGNPVGYYFADAGPDLIGNMAYGLDCGDINGDAAIGGADETVIAVWSIKSGRTRLPSRVVTLSYDGDARMYVIENTYDSDLVRPLDLRVADLNQDGRAEVLLNDSDSASVLRILAFDGTDLQEGSFRQVYATPTDPNMRIEIGKK